MRPRRNGSGTRVIERVWEWRFAAPPRRLWPVLADTARFNEAVGLPRYAVSETPLPDGTVRRIGSARKFGFALSWEEGVPEWVAPRYFAHQRRFHSGPLRLLGTEITFDPGRRAAPGCAIGCRWKPAVRLLEPLLRLGFPAALRPHARPAVPRGRANPRAAAASAGFRPPPPDLPAAVRERVTARARTVAEQGYRRRRPPRHASPGSVRQRCRAHAAAGAGPAMAGRAARDHRDLPGGGARGPA